MHFKNVLILEVVIRLITLKFCFLYILKKLYLISN